MAFPLLDRLLVVSHHQISAQWGQPPPRLYHKTVTAQLLSWGWPHITAAAQSIFQTPTQSHHHRVSWGQDCSFPSRLSCSCSCLRGPSYWRQSEPREKAPHPVLTRKEATKDRRQAQQIYSLFQPQSCFPTALLILACQVALHTCDEVYRATGVSRNINRFNMGSINLHRCPSSGAKQTEGQGWAEEQAAAFTSATWSTSVGPCPAPSQLAVPQAQVHLPLRKRGSSSKPMGWHLCVHGTAQVADVWGVA